MLSSCGRGPGPPQMVRDLHVPSGLPQMGPGPPRAYLDPRELSAQLTAREGSGAATCHADAGAGANLPLEAPSPDRIKCEWLRRALLPLGTGQLLSVHCGSPVTEAARQLPGQALKTQRRAYGQRVMMTSY